MCDDVDDVCDITNVFLLILHSIFINFSIHLPQKSCLQFLRGSQMEQKAKSFKHFSFAFCFSNLQFAFGWQHTPRFILLHLILTSNRLTTITCVRSLIRSFMIKNAKTCSHCFKSKCSKNKTCVSNVLRMSWCTMKIHPVHHRFNVNQSISTVKSSTNIVLKSKGLYYTLTLLSFAFRFVSFHFIAFHSVVRCVNIDATKCEDYFSKKIDWKKPNKIRMKIDIWNHRHKIVLFTFNHSKKWIEMEIHAIGLHFLLFPSTLYSFVF